MNAPFFSFFWQQVIVIALFKVRPFNLVVILQPVVSESGCHLRLWNENPAAATAFRTWTYIFLPMVNLSVTYSLIVKAGT